MQINVSGHHLEVTDSIRNYTLEKFERIERHFEHITNIHVILELEKKAQKAEATVHIKGGELFADASHDDLYAAIDALVDKLDRQILKHKEKKIDRPSAPSQVTRDGSPAASPPGTSPGAAGRSAGSATCPAAPAALSTRADDVAVDFDRLLPPNAPSQPRRSEQEARAAARC